MKYYLSETWMGYEVVREDGGHKEYLAGARNGRYKWVLDYTYAAHYRERTALKHLREVQSWHSNIS